jgi:hypothetical protein
VFRSYFSRWVSDGLRHLRPAILEPGPDNLTDVVGRYHAALAVPANGNGVYAWGA